MRLRQFKKIIDIAYQFDADCDVTYTAIGITLVGDFRHLRYTSNERQLKKINRLGGVLVTKHLIKITVI